MHLNEAVKVPVPERKIAYKTVSGKKYVYYTIACYRNEKGKPTNDRVSIGKLDEQTGLLIPNRNYYEIYLRLHRTIIAVRLRRQIFRQIVQKRRRNTDVFQGVFVQDGGKYASKRAAKARAANCAVMP